MDPIERQKTGSRIAESESAAILVAHYLIRNSISFACDPLPGDEWEFTVKHEAADRLETECRRANAQGISCRLIIVNLKFDQL